MSILNFLYPFFVICFEKIFIDKPMWNESFIVFWRVTKLLNLPINKSKIKYSESSLHSLLIIFSNYQCTELKRMTLQYQILLEFYLNNLC